MRFVGEAAEVHAAVVNGPTLTVTPATQEVEEVFERPAIAVLPFENRSEDGGFLADVLTDEVTAALGTWRYFPVIARNTAARYRGSDLSASEIGTAIGARYLLSGSLRKAGKRVKLQIDLTDAEADCMIWSDRISRDIGDLVEIEEEIAAQVATLIAPELEGAEARRTLHKPCDDLTAWELAMRAGWLIAHGSASDFAEAERLAQLSAERAPGWALPHTQIAVARFQMAMQGFSAASSEDAFTDTLNAARAALEIDAGAWIAHALTAVGELWTNRNHDRAIRHVTRAIDLNPSASMNYHFGGCITGFSGDPEGARRHQERLFRIDPVYPYSAVIEADLGLWHLLDGNLDEAGRSPNPRRQLGCGLWPRLSAAGVAVRDSGRTGAGAGGGKTVVGPEHAAGLRCHPSLLPFPKS